MGGEEVRGGQLVISRAGRDKDTHYLVLKKENGFLYLADGYRRRIDRPKKKNVKHVQVTNQVAEEVAAKVARGEMPGNQEIRKALALLLGAEE